MIDTSLSISPVLNQNVLNSNNLTDIEENFNFPVVTEIKTAVNNLSRPVSISDILSNADTDLCFSDNEIGVQEFASVKSADITKNSSELYSFCDWQPESAIVSDLSFIFGNHPVQSSTENVFLKSSLLPKIQTGNTCSDFKVDPPVTKQMENFLSVKETCDNNTGDHLIETSEILFERSPHLNKYESETSYKNDSPNVILRPVMAEENKPIQEPVNTIFNLNNDIETYHEVSRKSSENLPLKAFMNPVCISVSPLLNPTHEPFPVTKDKSILKEEHLTCLSTYEELHRHLQKDNEESENLLLEEKDAEKVEEFPDKFVIPIEDAAHVLDERTEKISDDGKDTHEPLAVEPESEMEDASGLSKKENKKKPTLKKEVDDRTGISSSARTSNAEKEQDIKCTESISENKLSSITPFVSSKTISSDSNYTFENVEVNIDIGLSQNDSFDEPEKTVKLSTEIALSGDDICSDLHDVFSFETLNVSESVSKDRDVSTVSRDVIGGGDSSTQIPTSTKSEKVSTRKFKKETHVDMPISEKNITKVIFEKPGEIPKNEPIDLQQKKISLPDGTHFIDIKRSEVEVNDSIKTVVKDSEGIQEHPEDKEFTISTLACSTDGTIEPLVTTSITQNNETSSHINTTILQPVVHQVVSSKKTIRKVVIIDGKEHVSETVIEEPEQEQSISSGRQIIVQSRKKITKIVKMLNGKVVEETETTTDEEPLISITQFNEEKEDLNKDLVQASQIYDLGESINESKLVPSSMDRAENVLHPSDGGVIIQNIIEKNEVRKEIEDISTINNEYCELFTSSRLDEKGNEHISPSVSILEQGQPSSSNMHVTLGDQETKEKFNPKKSLSLGTDSSDSYLADVQVTVTVPEEISLSVDIKQPKKKKSKKNKKKLKKESRIVSESCPADASNEESSRFNEPLTLHDPSVVVKKSLKNKEVTEKDVGMQDFSAPLEYVSSVTEFNPSEVETNREDNQTFIDSNYKAPTCSFDDVKKPLNVTKNKTGYDRLNLEGVVEEKHNFNKSCVPIDVKTLNFEENKLLSPIPVVDSKFVVTDDASDKTINKEITTLPPKEDSSTFEMPVSNVPETALKENYGTESISMTFPDNIMSNPLEAASVSVDPVTEFTEDTLTYLPGIIDKAEGCDLGKFQNLQPDSSTGNRTKSEEQSLEQKSIATELLPDQINKLFHTNEMVGKEYEPGSKEQKIKETELGGSTGSVDKENIIRDENSENIDMTDILSKPKINMEFTDEDHLDNALCDRVSSPLSVHLKKEAKTDPSLSCHIPVSSSFSSKNKRKRDKHSKLDETDDVFKDNTSCEGVREADKKEIDFSFETVETDVELTKNSICDNTELNPVTKIKTYSSLVNEKANDSMIVDPKETEYQIEITTSVESEQGNSIINIIQTPLSDINSSLISNGTVVNVSVMGEDLQGIEKDISDLEVSKPTGLIESSDSQDQIGEIKNVENLLGAPEQNLKLVDNNVCENDFEKPIDLKHTNSELFEVSNKNTNNDLLQTIKERILNVNTPSFIGLLSDLDNTLKRKEISHNLDLLKNSNEEEKESVIITTIILISEYLETITYIIINGKKYDRDVFNLEDKSQQISHLLNDLSVLKDGITCLRSNGGNNDLLNALEVQASAVSNILDRADSNVQTKTAEKREILTKSKNLLQLIQNLSENIENLEKDQTVSAEMKLNKLDGFEVNNADYEAKISVMLKKYPTQPDLINASHLLSVNEELLSGLRASLLQSLALAQEYRDTLVELENVTVVAKSIVASRVIVPSLEELQNEMQKERKFFISLSHCRSILESLESSLDQETRAATAKLHSRLHNIACDVLESAGERAVAIALGASRWTLLEQGLAEERGWLRVAQERVPNLSGVSSTDYHQYLSLYQSLFSDIEFHSARIWKLLETAHTLQGLISCNGLEESCEALRTTVGHLEDEVSENVKKLTEFKEIWSGYKSSSAKLNEWLDRIIAKYVPPLDIQAYWELKAEFEVQKSTYNDVCKRFMNAMEILQLIDKAKQMNQLNEITNKWDILNRRVEEIELSIPSNLSPGDRLTIIETRLDHMEASLNNIHDMSDEGELNLYIGKLQVLKEEAVNIENELLCYGLGPASERRKLASLQGRAGLLKTQSSGEYAAAASLRDRLAAVRNALIRVSRVHNKALKVLDQWEPTLDGDEDIVHQALTNVKEVVKSLCDERMELSWIRETLSRLPISLRAKLSLVNLEREVKMVSETHLKLSNRAEDLLSVILSRLDLWKSYGTKLENVRSTVREADYMMELLRIDTGPIDLPRIVKASTRLQGVKESLNEREGALEDLRTAEERLEEVVRAEVGEKLKAEVREEEAAWARAEAGLGDLASRYQRAATLWAQYKQALSAADVPAVESLSLQDWEKKQEAVKQAQEIAEKISDETGIPGLLTSEVNLLTRKLADAKEIVSTSDETPSHSEKLRSQLIEAINEKLNRVPEGSTTEKLVSLRNSLLDLGKKDAQITNIASNSSKEDIPVADLMKLWEKAFRKTFQDYHHLSSQLAKGGDCATVFNLWSDYLNHVDNFLESELPQHYHELHEINHLCQVHYTVLGSQKALLPAETAALDSLTIQQLDLLTNMHNETLTKVLDKQKEIETRILYWDSYRQDQSTLLEWLKRMERERNQLKLRYIHSKTVGKTIIKIEELLMCMTEGESLEISLKDKLHTIIPFCDDSFASSLQLELSSLSHRLSNLHAALLTWKDYLEKVKSNIYIYEKQVENVENSIDKINAILEEENKFIVDSENQQYLENKLQTISKVSDLVQLLSKEIESLEDAKDILKDCLSPADLKSMSQKCWLLSQQQNEFEHQLTLAEHIIRDKLHISKVYEQRLSKFLTWLSTINHKFTVLPNDATSALSILEREFRAEVSLKRSEMDWLTKTGQDIGDVSSLKKVTEGWCNLQESMNKLTEKLNGITKGIPKLAEEMNNLQIWLHDMEKKLSVPIVIKKTSKKHIASLLKEHEQLEDEIIKENSKIKDVLNLSESLLDDCKSCNITLDVDAITVAVVSLENRWRKLSENSTQRRLSLENLAPRIEKAHNSAKELKIWLSELEAQIKDIKNNLKSTRLNMLPDVDDRIIKLVADLNSGNSGKLETLDNIYLSLHSEYQLPEELLNVPVSLLKRWEDSKEQANDLSNKIRIMSADREQWTRSAAKAVSAMAKIDALLTLVEVQESQEILEIEVLLQTECKTLKQADSCGLKVMEWCSDEDVLQIQTTVDEYQNLWKDINERLNKIKECKEEKSERSSVQFEDQSVEVNTLKFETDQSTQVDTLGWSRPLARKGTFSDELIKTTEELEILLSKLEDLANLETQAEINKCIGECESNYELAKHLSETLIDQCSATVEEALVDKIKYLGEKFDLLRLRALNKQNHLRETSARGRLTCPLCSNKNWQQLDNDLWRLEQWLQYAKGSLSSQPSNPPSSIEQLEDVIQDQRELLLNLDSHRSLVVSMNIVGTHLAEHSEDEVRARELRNRLTSINKQWEQVCELATSWQAKLQTALMQNQEFYDTMTELSDWLEKTETSIRQAEPIELTDPTEIIEAKYIRFKEMYEEVERCESRVRSLEEAVRQVLPEDDRAVERLGRLKLRLISLSLLIDSYVKSLSAALGHQPAPNLSSLNLLTQQLLGNASSGNEQPSSGDEVDTSTLIRCHRFLGRVMRASVPISAFLLLLLGAASFVPVVEQDFTCANSFLYNIGPILRYPNGRPPV